MKIWKWIKKFFASKHTYSDYHRIEFKSYPYDPHEARAQQILEHQIHRKIF